ncbi:MAG: hypothetical protein CYPHOPRED_003168, partial [Cyphobasidiales sp. Tagirdzhanova-0007]
MRARNPSLATRETICSAKDLKRSCCLLTHTLGRPSALGQRITMFSIGLPAGLLGIIGLLAADIAASPLLASRAGGPGFTPVIQPCSVSFPFTTPDTPSCEYQSFSPNVSKENEVYHWDLVGTPDEYATLWENCIEQCNYL